MTKICRGPAGESPAAHERTCPTEQRNQPVTQERETSMIPQKQILVVEDNHDKNLQGACRRISGGT